MASATVPLLDETVPFGDEEELNQNGGIKRLSHPYVTFFHILFRGAALATYVFWGLFSDSFIKCFLLVVFWLSADFYLVKNLSGRLLVGMRWWNYVDDDGRSHWVFESKKGENYEARINPHEARIFWTALVVCPVLWALFFVVALFGFKFKWMLLVMIALSLNGANLYGYIKCNFGANANLSTTTTDFVKSQVLKNAVSLMSQPSSSNSAAKPTTVA